MAHPAIGAAVLALLLAAHRTFSMEEPLHSSSGGVPTMVAVVSAVPQQVIGLQDVKRRKVLESQPVEYGRDGVENHVSVGVVPASTVVSTAASSQQGGALPPSVTAAFSGHASAGVIHHHTSAAGMMPTIKKPNTTAICTDCGVKHASFGMKEDRKRRWCGACAKSNGHPDAVNVNAKMCEDCGVKMASFGTHNDQKKRWCSSCAKTKEHTGAQYLGKRYMCEDCNKKRAAWGDGTNKKRRWCGSCVKTNGHKGATIIGVKLCEDCNDKQATFGVEPDKVC